MVYLKEKKRKKVVNTKYWEKRSQYLRIWGMVFGGQA